LSTSSSGWRHHRPRHPCRSDHEPAPHHHQHPGPPRLSFTGDHDPAQPSGVVAEYGEKSGATYLFAQYAPPPGDTPAACADPLHRTPMTLYVKRPASSHPRSPERQVFPRSETSQRATRTPPSPAASAYSTPSAPPSKENLPTVAPRHQLTQFPAPVNGHLGPSNKLRVGSLDGIIK
jgi:hypothetical protein